jgi:predicted enzyme involved in methoxymalonyl-ACP biosynthesis
VVIVRKNPQIWVIDTWLMSCRALTRGIEEALMNLLMAEAREVGVEAIVGEYLPTLRNAPVADFFQRLGFTPVEDEIDAGTRYRAYPGLHMRLKSFVEIKRVLSK